MKSFNELALVALLVTVVTWGAHVSAGEPRPQPQQVRASISDSLQTPTQPIVSSPVHQANFGSLSMPSSEEFPGSSANSAAAPPSSVSATATVSAITQPQRLPNVNIYINKSEIKKLLGIDTRINYVSNGNINTYPLGFTIPMGYNQSDMIFTWQNLGKTNVNYSISLVIGNSPAVEMPIINITRIGLIPRQEKVFKITLPCSGKATDEVDVQVLINIQGYLEPDEAGPELDVAGSPGSSGAETGAGPAAGTAAADSMQADQASGKQGRFVSHTLAIKRKKICTIHPVQVSVQPRPQPAPPVSQVPQQPQQQQQQQPPALAQSPAAHSAQAQPAPAANPATKWPPSGSEPSAIGRIQFPSKPAAPGVPGARGPAAGSPLVSGPNSVTPADMDPLELSTHMLEQLNLIPAAARPGASPATIALQQQQQQAAASRRAGPADLGQYPNWMSRVSPIPPDNPLNDIVAPNQLHQRHSFAAPAASGSSLTNNGPLVVALIVLSLLISLALVVVIILSWSSHQRQGPLEKLNALTDCLLRRSHAGHHVANKCKGPVGIGSTAISSLRVGHKSNASSVSGLSAVSGHSHSKSSAAGAHCYKTNCALGPNGFYTTNTATGHHYTNQLQPHHQQQQQHHYQHPPTADLLGTGYQCQPAASQAPQQQQQQYPVYHIATGNTNQTTRLIWNNGNGTSPDGFTIDGGSYMPLSNAPRSDNGSVYQYIS